MVSQPKNIMSLLGFIPKNWDDGVNAQTVEHRCAGNTKIGIGKRHESFAKIGLGSNFSVCHSDSLELLQEIGGKSGRQRLALNKALFGKGHQFMHQLNVTDTCPIPVMGIEAAR